VLLVVGDEVTQGEAVVGGDEVDGGERVAAVLLVQVGGAGEALRELAHVALTAPEVAYRVAILPVPLGPEHREVADLIAAGPDVPRLGDQLHLREDRVLMDRVEEGAESVHVVELARERRGEVEAEPVDMALEHPVAERVHDQPQHRWMHGVERVAGAGEVHVEARLVRHEPVVASVVEAAEGEHRPEVVSLGGVVVDDVEDHLDPGPVQCLHQPLELAHLLAATARRGVEGMRREIADGRVAPVVGEPAIVKEALVCDVVDRQQLDRRDAELAEVRERRLGGKPGVCAAQVVADLGVPLREPLHVHLVDHGVVPGRPRGPVVLPVEVVVDHDALRNGVGVVLVVELEIGVLGKARHVREDVGQLPLHRPLDRLRVGIDQELVRVEAVPGSRVVWPVDAVAVALARGDVREVAVPVVRGDLVQLDARLAVAVEQAELYALGVLGEKREVRPLAVPGGAERERLSRPDLHPRRRYSGASQTAPSGGNVSVAENGCSCQGTPSASTPPRLPTPLPP